MSPNDQGNAVAENDMKDMKDDQPPLALTDVTVPAPVIEIHSTSVPPALRTSALPALPL